MNELGEFFGNWWQEFASGGSGLAVGYWLRGVVSNIRFQFRGQFNIDVGNRNLLDPPPPSRSDEPPMKGHEED